MMLTTSAAVMQMGQTMAAATAGGDVVQAGETPASAQGKGDGQ
jgi:hypothetical protein